MIIFENLPCKKEEPLEARSSACLMHALIISARVGCARVDARP
jgi:hypothetical protein